MIIKKKKKNKKNTLILTNLYVKSSIKNTLISLTKKNGNVLKQWSTKALKKTKFKKNTTYNIQLIIYKINEYLKKKKIKKINIYLKGLGVGKRNILKNLDKKIKIGFIFDKTPISFNGCRKKKIKRK